MATKDKDEQENKGHHLLQVVALYLYKNTTTGRWLCFRVTVLFCKILDPFGLSQKVVA